MSHRIRPALAIVLVVFTLSLSSGCAALSNFPAPFYTTKKQVDTQMAIARVQEEQGETSSAKKVYEEIVKKKPKHSGAHQRLAIIAVKHGKPKTAEEHFNIARKHDPKNLQLLNDLGYFYYLEGRLTEAEQILSEVVDEDPGQMRAVNNLGLVVGLQGRTTEAYDLFRKVGTEADAQANLAFVFAQLGEVEKAQFHYSRALTHNPRMKPAAHALLQIAEICHQKRQHENMLAQQQLPGTSPEMMGAYPTTHSPALHVNHQSQLPHLPGTPHQAQPIPYHTPHIATPDAVQPLPYYPDTQQQAAPIQSYPVTSPQPLSSSDYEPLALP